MFKHGGGGRYNAILEFKRRANKKMMRKKEKEKKIYVREKEKNMSMCKNKIK
jgi:hypothetical protein